MGIPRDAATLAKYQHLYDTCVVRPEKQASVNWCVKRIKEHKTLYVKLESLSHIPWWVFAVIHGMESSFDDSTWLANGDPLTGPTKHEPPGLTVPGKQPPYDFVDAALVSIKHEGWNASMHWDLPNALITIELYNGAGYWNKGHTSQYLWSFTNHEQPGRWGEHVWLPDEWSDQTGVCAMLRGLEAAGEISLSTAPLPPVTHAEPTWFELFRLEENGTVMTGCVPMASSQPCAAWAGVSSHALAKLFLSYPDHHVLVAPPSKPWPGALKTSGS